jgi:hypothetical protein
LSFGFPLNHAPAGILQAQQRQQADQEDQHNQRLAGGDRRSAEFNLYNNEKDVQAPTGTSVKAAKCRKSIPALSFLSHSKQLADVFPQIMFGVDPKDLPYDAYRRIAVSSLPRKQKEALRADDARFCSNACRQKHYRIKSASVTGDSLHEVSSGGE